jgi:hypothetical protein
MRQLLGWMLGALLLLGQAQLADAQVAVSVGTPFVGTNVAVGQPYGVYPTTGVYGYAAPVVTAPAYYAPAYVPTATYYSSAYRGFRRPMAAYYTAPVPYTTTYVAPAAYVGPFGRMRVVRRPYRYFP